MAVAPLPQRVWPGTQLTEQLPLWQVRPGPQARPQAPQLVGSVEMLAQYLAPVDEVQVTSGLPQLTAQALFEQTVPAGQMLAQLPQ